MDTEQRMNHLLYPIIPRTSNTLLLQCTNSSNDQFRNTHLSLSHSFSFSLSRGLSLHTHILPHPPTKHNSPLVPLTHTRTKHTTLYLTNRKQHAKTKQRKERE